jgi:hypothetical protein
MEDFQWFSYSATSSTWTHGLIMFSYEGDGTLSDGFDTELYSGCYLAQGICAATSQGDPDPQQVAVVPDSSYEFEWLESDRGPSSTTAGTSNDLYTYIGVDFSGTTPAGGAWSLIDGNFPGRCDTIATSTDGCVNNEFVPVAAYDSTVLPLVAPVAQHVYNAQTGGLTTAWGVDPRVKSNGSYLTRDMNEADINANRQTACGNVTVPPGDSCDEFPLASTHQGASFNSDYSIAIVPSSANSSQGGIMSNFYSSNRVIDGDLFLVRAILPDGTASW